MQTPWIFKMTPPWHLSYLDRLLLDGQSAPAFGRSSRRAAALRPARKLAAVLLQRQEAHVLRPALALAGGADRLAKVDGSGRYYYPEIKKVFRQWEDYFEAQVQAMVDDFDLSTLTPDQRQQLEARSLATVPRRTAATVHRRAGQSLMKREFMRFFHFYLGVVRSTCSSPGSSTSRTSIIRSSATSPSWSTTRSKAFRP